MQNTVELKNDAVVVTLSKKPGVKFLRKVIQNLFYYRKIYVNFEKENFVLEYDSANINIYYICYFEHNILHHAIGVGVLTIISTIPETLEFLKLISPIIVESESLLYNSEYEDLFP